LSSKLFFSCLIFASKVSHSQCRLLTSLVNIRLAR
jgi:hypothetical protein